MYYNVPCSNVRLTSPLATTTQRQPPTDASVAHNSACTTVNRFSQDKTGPHGSVEDTVQRDMASMRETMHSGPVKGGSTMPRLSCVGSCNLEPVSMELTCCPLHNEGTASTNTTAAHSMHKERIDRAIQQQSDSLEPQTAEVISLKSATQTQTNHNTNTLCLQASLETDATTSSPIHCEPSKRGEQEHTLRDHFSNELESANLINSSQNMQLPSADVGNPFEVREEEEEESECMDVSEVMRTLLDDIRMPDPGLDVVPLQVKLPYSPLPDAEWPSMEEMHCKQKESCDQAGMTFVGRNGAPLPVSMGVGHLSLNALEAHCDSPSRHVSAAARVSKNCNSEASQIHESDEAVQELAEQLPALQTKYLPIPSDLVLDEMGDTAHDVAGACDLRPRSSTPLFGNQQGTLVRAAWDCSPVQHYSILEGLSAETSAQMCSVGSSEVQEQHAGDSAGTASYDRADAVQLSANVRRGRSLATSSTNKKRASSRNPLWPKRVLNTTTSTETNLAASRRERGKREEAVDTNPINNDPYSFTCSHNSGGELGLPATPNPSSLPPPPTSQTKSTSYPMQHPSELEASSLLTSSIRSVCAIIYIGGGGLPPVRTLLRKGSRRQLRHTKKRKGSNTDGLVLPHHGQVDILCTL